MNGIETNAALRAIEHQRKVECIDAVAIRYALAGTPVTLTAAEEGTAITICDVYRLDQETVARGMGICVRTLQRRIQERHNEIVTPRMLASLTDSVREPIDALVDAVDAGDGSAVAGILLGCDPVQLGVLVIGFASLAADARRKEPEPGHEN